MDYKRRIEQLEEFLSELVLRQDRTNEEIAQVREEITQMKAEILQVKAGVTELKERLDCLARKVDALEIGQIRAENILTQHSERFAELQHDITSGQERLEAGFGLLLTEIRKLQK